MREAYIALLERRPAMFPAGIADVLLCRELHCLPVAGGLLEQPATFIADLQLVMEAEAEAQDWYRRNRGDD